MTTHRPRASSARTRAIGPSKAFTAVAGKSEGRRHRDGSCGRMAHMLQKVLYTRTGHHSAVKHSRIRGGCGDGIFASDSSSGGIDALIEGGNSSSSKRKSAQERELSHAFRKTITEQHHCKVVVSLRPCGRSCAAPASRDAIEPPMRSSRDIVSKRTALHRVLPPRRWLLESLSACRHSSRDGRRVRRQDAIHHRPIRERARVRMIRASGQTSRLPLGPHSNDEKSYRRGAGEVSHVVPRPECRDDLISTRPC